MIDTQVLPPPATEQLPATVSSQSKKYPEAAYLLLVRWLSSTRVLAWMSANPGTVFRPMAACKVEKSLSSIETYHAYHVSSYQRDGGCGHKNGPCSTMNFPGTHAMYDALNKNLVVPR